jgi:prolyl 4-hydroxylase
MVGRLNDFDVDDGKAMNGVTDTLQFPVQRIGRFFHNFVANLDAVDQTFPDSSDALTFPPHNVDHSVMYWDDALSAVQCQSMIDGFEQSSEQQYAGAVVIDGVRQALDSIKKNTEINLTQEAATFKWFAAEKLLAKTVSKYLDLYQDSNIVLATLPNPFGDEGFRIKRYLNDGSEHHSYHADSGQEKYAAPRRLIAVLIYLNDVTEGGETIFLNQGISVTPVAGRIVMFPTSYSFVHAGRRPISGSKYVVINFLTTR